MFAALAPSHVPPISHSPGKATSFLHSVCGLRLQSDQAIPGLIPLSPDREVDPDVNVVMGGMPAWFAAVDKSSRELRYRSSYTNGEGVPLLEVWKLAEGAHWLCYADGAEFVVDGSGGRVWAGWRDPLTAADAAAYLLGPVLGFLLCLRRLVCLHASSVAIGEQAIALLGPPTAGKSTTAAAFAGLGLPVLTDDVLPLLDRGETFLVQPTYPSMRLWPDAVRALYGSPDVLPPLTPNWDKRYLDLTRGGHRFQDHPLPLAGIYLLGERTEQRASAAVEPVPAKDRLIALVSNVYTNYLLDRSMRGLEFELSGRVVASIPLRQVARPKHLDLADLCACILNDFRSLN